MSVGGPLLVLVAFGAALFLLSQPFWPGHVEQVAERDALRRATALRREGARELWDLSSAPARHVSTI